MAGLVVSALLGVGAKVPASMDAPVREVFHTPPGMSAPIEPLLLYQASQDEKCRHWVDSVYNRMNLREKVGQLFIYTIAPVQTKRNMQLLRDAVHTYKVGGLLFSGGKIQNQATLTNEAQRMARCPLLITFDGEWGLSMRLRGTPVFPRNMVLGCIQDNRLIYEYGREMARQCREMGVQVNFAPVADVNINPDNPVINTRSFGEDPVKVADKVIAYASGLESGKVLSVCKHFPGHGGSIGNSHQGFSLSNRTEEELKSCEIVPFKTAIENGADCVMVAHMSLPNVTGDNTPATLSKKVVTDMLKTELNFKGVVFSDSMSMGAITENYGTGDACVKAVKAGIDMVLMPENLEEAYNAVLEAVKNGEISQERLDDAVSRIIKAKIQRGIIK